MNIQLYDIEKSIRDILESPDSVIEETGELKPEALYKLNALELGKQQVVKSLGCYYHSEIATAEVIDSQIKRLQSLKKTALNKAESVKNYIANNLQAGEELNLGTIKVSWRKSESVEIGPFINLNDVPAELKKVETDPEKVISKTAAKKYFKEKGVLPFGISIKENQNLVIQ